MAKLGRGRPEETRARILAAASKLFYSKGVRAVGVDLVAAEADVTKRTLYKHFETKDALIAAYLEAQNEPVLAALITSITSVDDNVITQIEALFELFAQQAGNPRWHGCPFARAVCELRGHTGDRVADLAAAHKRAFEDWLADHLAARGVGGHELVAKQLLVLVDGAITQLLIHHDRAYAKAAGQAAVTLLQAQLKSGS